MMDQTHILTPFVQKISMIDMIPVNNLSIKTLSIKTLSTKIDFFLRILYNINNASLFLKNISTIFTFALI